MDISSVFSGDTLKAEDLQGREPTVTIASVEMKTFDNGNKLLIKFDGAKKALIANKTNSKRIGMMYGNNTDNWLGKPITLYVDIVDFQGEPTEAIRVRVIKQPTPSVAAGGYRHDDRITSGPQPPMRQTPAADPDDDVPF